MHGYVENIATFTFSLANITSMCWSPDSQILCSSGGKVIHVWTNQVVLEETLRDLKKQLESATSEAHKVRKLQNDDVIICHYLHFVSVEEIVRENQRY